MSARSPSFTQAGGLWAFAPWITIALFLLPVAAGLVGTVLPAFGYLSAIGGEQLSVGVWRALIDQPGVMTSVRLSVQTGFLATAFLLALAAAFRALLPDRASYRWLLRLVSLFQSNPDAFIDNNMNRLKGGVMLTVPSAQAVKSVPPAEAREVIHAQSAEFGASGACAPAPSRQRPTLLPT